jgi:1-aminocyclopropane-1-carboxylate deaminase/D-cysteine desulfhydrase-like pyridoxal-dependent ACC family enzyme
MIPLFEEHPRLKEKLPYVSLGDLPTPVTHLRQLGKEIGTDRLYLKDDGMSGTPYGGNKVRKLEFLIADALRKGAKEVLTFGCAGSNHALATGIYAKKHGLKCTSVLLTQPNAHYVRRNLLLNVVHGTELYHYDTEGAARPATILRWLFHGVRDGKLPYMIPIGGSSPLGTVGFVNAGFELKVQIANGAMSEPDLIFIPMGSMGTAVGLMLGVKAAGLKTRVVPVRVVPTKIGSREKFVNLFRKTEALLCSNDLSFPKVEITDDDLKIEDTFFGGEYARFTQEGMAAVELAGKTDGLHLEGTYSGKTMAAVIDHVKKSGSKDSVILFWNTHNTQDFSETIKDVDYHQLPPAFHRYFEEEVQELDRDS